MPRSRYRIYERAEPHFLTCSAVAWLPLFLSFPSSCLGTDDLRGSGLAACPEAELRRSSVPKPELGNQCGGG